ncbi:hypothetical protein Q8F55_007322 [Vanrija albida]|uniref:Uncharacterized protein n=1 Tax=Vanrija albida TaxID=181172 RepID=A0ABR3PZL8_9TREE
MPYARVDCDLSDGKNFYTFAAPGTVDSYWELESLGRRLSSRLGITHEGVVCYRTDDPLEVLVNLWLDGKLSHEQKEYILNEMRRTLDKVGILLKEDGPAIDKSLDNVNSWDENVEDAPLIPVDSIAVGERKAITEWNVFASEHNPPGSYGLMMFTTTVMCSCSPTDEQRDQFEDMLGSHFKGMFKYKLVPEAGHIVIEMQTVRNVPDDWEDKAKSIVEEAFGTFAHVSDQDDAEFPAPEAAVVDRSLSTPAQPAAHSFTVIEDLQAKGLLIPLCEALEMVDIEGLMGLIQSVAAATQSINEGLITTASEHPNATDVAGGNKEAGTTEVENYQRPLAHDIATPCTDGPQKYSDEAEGDSHGADRAENEDEDEDEEVVKNNASAVEGNSSDWYHELDALMQLDAANDHYHFTSNFSSAATDGSSNDTAGDFSDDEWCDWSDHTNDGGDCTVGSEPHAVETVGEGQVAEVDFTSSPTNEADSTAHNHKTHKDPSGTDEEDAN